jgi:general stress protein 26
MTAAVVLQYLQSHRYAVVSTVSRTGYPQAAMVGIAVNDEFEIVFDSLESTRKVLNIRLNPKVSLVAGGWTTGDERTVQCEGLADFPRGSKLDALCDVYYRCFPEGKQRISWQGLVYVRVRPTWLRYSDFNLSPADIREFGPVDLRTGM